MFVSPLHKIWSSKLVSFLVSLYALGILFFSLGYVFFGDATNYKINPELENPRKEIALETESKMDGMVEGVQKLSAIRIELKPDDLLLVGQGKRLYKTHCAVCHGIDLEGQKGWKKNQSSDSMLAPPHDERGHTWHHSDKMLFSLTKFGVKKITGKISAMPGYGNILSDEEILSVLSFIKSTWPVKIRIRHDEINNKVLSK